MEPGSDCGGWLEAVNPVGGSFGAGDAAGEWLEALDSASSGLAALLWARDFASSGFASLLAARDFRGFDFERRNSARRIGAPIKNRRAILRVLRDGFILM